MATWSHLGFQDTVSPLTEQLIFFHDHAMVILNVFTSLVAYLMMSLLSNILTNRFLLENQTIEMIRTILPAVIHVIIALPSLRRLYLLGEVN